MCTELLVVINCDYRSESAGFVNTHFNEYGWRRAKREFIHSTFSVNHRRVSPWARTQICGYRYHLGWLILFGIFSLLSVCSLCFDVITLADWQLNGGYHFLNRPTLSKSEKRENLDENGQLAAVVPNIYNIHVVTVRRFNSNPTNTVLEHTVLFLLVHELISHSCDTNI